MPCPEYLNLLQHASGPALLGGAPGVELRGLPVRAAPEQGRYQAPRQLRPRTERAGVAERAHRAPGVRESALNQGGGQVHDAGPGCLFTSDGPALGRPLIRG